MQYFPVVLFIMPYKGALTFESVDVILKRDLIQMKTTEQYFPVVLFVTVYIKVVLPPLRMWMESYSGTSFSESY